MRGRSAVVGVVILAGLITAAWAAEGFLETLKVREGHTKIWLTPERIDALKKKMKAEPIPGNDVGSQALGYVLKGDEKAAADAVKNALDFNLSEDVLTKAVASDQYRWQAFVPIIYDWCYDKMTPDERTKFLERYGHIVEAMNAKSWGGPAMPGSNYYAGYMRNAGIFGLAAFGDTPLAKTALENAFVTRWKNSSLPFCLDGAKGGVVGEGSQYDRYNIGYVLWLAEAARTASNYDMMKDTNFFREWAYYTIYSTTPNAAKAKGETETYWQRFPFGDCEFWGGYPAIDDITGDAMRDISLAYAGEKCGQHAAWYVEQTDPEKGLFGWVVEDGRKVNSAEFKSLPLDYYAPGAGYAFTRSGWEEAATSMMLQLGVPALDKGSHRHQDAGTFQIVRGGSWMTKESTGYSTQFNGTTSNGPLAHNSIVFDGRGQVGAYPDGAPQVLAIESKPTFFHAVVDLSKAYRASASPNKDRDDTPGAVKCIREFLYVRPDLIIIFDRVESTTPDVKKTFVMHFTDEPKETVEDRPLVVTKTPEDVAKTTKVKYYILETGGSQVVYECVYPKDVKYSLIDEGDVPGKKASEGFYQWRLEATQSGAKEQYFLTIVAAQEKFDMPPHFDTVEKEDTIGAIISQPGRKTEIHFNKNPKEFFGKLIIDAAGAYGHSESNLPVGIETVTVSGDGVGWSKPLE